MIKGIDLKSSSLFITAPPLASVDHPHQINPAAHNDSAALVTTRMMAQKEAHFGPQVRQSTASQECETSAGSLAEQRSRKNSVVR